MCLSRAPSSCHQNQAWCCSRCGLSSYLELEPKLEPLKLCNGLQIAWNVLQKVCKRILKELLKEPLQIQICSWPLVLLRIAQVRKIRSKGTLPYLVASPSPRNPRDSVWLVIFFSSIQQEDFDFFRFLMELDVAGLRGWFQGFFNLPEDRAKTSCLENLLFRKLQKYHEIPLDLRRWHLDWMWFDLLDPGSAGSESIQTDLNCILFKLVLLVRTSGQVSLQDGLYLRTQTLWTWAKWAKCFSYLKVEAGRKLEKW